MEKLGNNDNVTETNECTAPEEEKNQVCYYVINYERTLQPTVNRKTAASKLTIALISQLRTITNGTIHKSHCLASFSKT